jgi:hypothetical protein
VYAVVHAQTAQLLNPGPAHIPAVHMALPLMGPQ